MRTPFKVKAYYNAAKILAGFDDLDAAVTEGRLKEIKGIGETLAAKIVEYTETGKIAFHEELKERIPPQSSSSCFRSRTSGPRRSRCSTTSWASRASGSSSTPAGRTGSSTFFGFGEKTQEKILKGIEFFRQHKGEFLFGEVYPLALRTEGEASRSCARRARGDLREHQKTQGDRARYRRARRGR